jgi:hypothetical protein
VDTTVNIEFTTDTKEHLKTLEHELKHIHDVKVDLVEPREHTAPALVALDFHKSSPQAIVMAAQFLYDFLHENGSQGQKHIDLVTVEGDRIDIEPLSADQIKSIMIGAEEND